MGKFKKIFYYSTIFVIITLSVLYFYPKKLNREYSAVMYRIGDSNYAENTRILIDGYLSKGIFKGDRFQGTMTVGDKQFTKIDMRFDSLGRSQLSYFDEGMGDYISYGTLYTKNKMKELSISVYEDDRSNKGGKSWSSSDGLLICAPANNRDEAVKLTNNLMNHVLGSGD